MQTITRRIEIEGVDVAISTQKELREAIKLTNKAIDEVDKSTPKYQKLNNQLVYLREVQKENRRENRELGKTMLASGEVATGAYRKLSLQLSKLKKEYKDLAAENKDQTDEAKQLLSQIQQLDGRLKTIDKRVGESYRNVGNYQSALGGIGNKIAAFAGAYISFEAVSRVTKELIVDSIRLSNEMQGINYAFERVAGGVEALEATRRSTRGLLSDMDLKRAIVELDNFNISQENTATLYEFLAIRATQTGKSIDKLKDSLVEGLSKESKLRIDNIGISTAALNAELEKTPDFVQAVANIAKVEIAEAGDILDEAAKSTEKWNAAYTNLKIAIGDSINRQGGFINGFISKGAELVQTLSEITQEFGFLGAVTSIVNPAAGVKLNASAKAYQAALLEIRKISDEELATYETREELAINLSQLRQKLFGEDAKTAYEKGKAEVIELINYRKRLEDLTDDDDDDDDDDDGGDKLKAEAESVAFIKNEIKELTEQLDNENLTDTELERVLDELINKEKELQAVEERIESMREAIERRNAEREARSRGRETVDPIEPLETLKIDSLESDTERELPDSGFGDRNEEETAKLKEELEKRAELYSEFAGNVGSILGEMLSGDEEAREESLRKLGVFLVDTIEKNLLAAIAKIYIGSLSSIESITTFGAAGIAKAAALTALVKGAANAVRGQLIGEEGIVIKNGSIGKDGVVSGKRHYKGGVQSYLHGVPVEIEGGEFADFDEYGNAMVVNRMATSHNRSLLSRIYGKSFAGKGQLISRLNQKHGGRALAEDGIYVPDSSTGVRNMISFDVSRQFINIERMVYEGAKAGTMEGANRGLYTATERARKLEDLTRKTRS